MVAAKGRASGWLGWSVAAGVFVVTIMLMLTAQEHAVRVVQRCTHDLDIGVSGRIGALFVLCSTPFIAVAVASAQFVIRRWLPGRAGVRWAVSAVAVLGAWAGCYVMVVHEPGLPAICRD